LGIITSGELCTPDTKLCIEGFGSSANSFTYNVFRYLSNDLRIAHHTHAIANIKIALGYGIPTLILFRPPYDAIPSHVLRFESSLLADTLKYTEFYRFVASISDRVILASFEEVTTDIEVTIERVSTRTGIVFDSKDDICELKSRVFQHIREWTRDNRDASMVALPCEERNQQKQHLGEELQHLRPYQDAEEIYKVIKGLYWDQKDSET
jgi:hypothetical protein